MAEESECIRELYNPDFHRYVFTFSPAGDGATGGQTKTEGAGGGGGLLEGNGGETSQPGGQEDCTATQDKTQKNSAEDDGSNHTHRYTIPVADLTLEKLPPDIRTKKNLGLILEMSERVVRLHSTGTNEERADGEKPEPQGSDSVVGAGLIYTVLRTRGGPEVVVVTPPDVLSSSQAVQRSAAEVAVERRGSKTACSAPGRARPSWSRPDPQEGFTMAAYAFDPTAEVQGLSIAQKPGEYPVLKPSCRTGDRCGSRMCVLSWTPAGGKCVSFGRVLEETQGQLIHDAPVPPGCSGCPVVVLSPSGNSFLLTTRAGEVQAGGAAVEVDWDRVKAAALLMEGFVPVPDLTLELLPEEMRSEENLQLILETAKLVVRVNNNKVSDTRPEDDQFRARGVKSTTGTGRIMDTLDQYRLNGVEVFTNKHILFSPDEAYNSTIDINFDGPQRKRYKVKRSSRTMCRFHKSFSDNDFCVAWYFTKGVNMPFLRPPAFKPGFLKTWDPLPTGTSKGPKPVVAVVSHPLGQPKHVSFGHLCFMGSFTSALQHDAPTKPGSSGAPILLFHDGSQFPEKCPSIHHRSTDRKTGLKMCGWTLSRPSLGLQTDTDEITRTQAVQTVDSLQLLQFAPVFAAFLLHPERYRSSLQKQAPNVCCELSRMDVHSSVGKSGTAGEMLLEIAQDAPSLFPPDIPRGDVTTALDVLMTSGTPCHCRRLVHALTRSGSSDKTPDAEVFTSTAAAPREFDAEKPWPWSRDISRDTPCGERECLLQACLAALEVMNNVKPFLNLLVLILNANRIANRIGKLIEEPDTTTGTTTLDASEEIIYRRCFQSSLRGEVKVQQPADAQGREGHAGADSAKRGDSELHGDVDTSEVVELVRQVFICALVFASVRLAEEEPCPDFCRNAVARWRHLHRHHAQDYHKVPHAIPSPHPSPPPCPCGAPSPAELLMGMDCVLVLFRYMPGSIDVKTSRPMNDVTGMHRQGRHGAQTHDQVLLDSLIVTQANETPPSRWDTVENFSQGRDILTRAVTAMEVFELNCRSLLRLLRQDIHSWYVCEPVSVFGRPGDWPGHVTPARVKAEAWRLIQDAFSHSGFGTAVLQALEEDADRREKFTDLYVDMKQLKFQGKLDSRLLTLKEVKSVLASVRETVVHPGMGSVLTNPIHSVMHRFMMLLLDWL